jgi:MFS family permease
MATATATITVAAPPLVHRGPGGLTRCTPGGVCPPNAQGLRCRFPGGDAPGARREADGSVVCTPAASSVAQPFTVTAEDDDSDNGPSGSPRPAVTLGEGVLAPSVTGMRAFAAMSTCYLLFTTTDGALRMVVLFHAFTLGFSAWEVALMFGLYELAGVVTNILAGVSGARWGIRPTLLVGLGIQLAGIALLFGFDIPWDEPGARWKALVWVAVANGVGGVAKDLVKLGGKTVSKLVTPEERQSQLFAVVAWITGMKNSMKGVGYFIGAASLSVSLAFALALNAALILIALPIAVFGLSADVGRTRSKNLTLRTILTPAPNVKRLSLARAFLFGSRDLWFEVALPFFLRDGLSGLGWSRTAAGASLAGFIIVYGQIQSATPRLLLRPLGQEPANKLVQVLWNTALTAVAVALTVLFVATDVFGGAAGSSASSAASAAAPLADRTGALWGLLAAFCLVFAANSSIHSYLIVRYSGGDKVAADVGFYYMSNACGRFVGTLVSGALYEWSAGGNKAEALGWCFLASALFSAASTLLTLRIDDQKAGLMCGRYVVVKGTEMGGAGKEGGGGGGAHAVAPTAQVGPEGAGTKVEEVGAGAEGK